MYDVAIIGLGPAGATLARLLAGKLRVVCLDKKRPEDGGFEKPCGGLLAPDAQKELARFSLTLPTEVLATPQIFSVQTLDARSGLLRHYQRCYINVNRDRFDRWLLSLIPPAVTRLSDCRCTGVAKTPDGWQVSYRQNGQTATLQARYLVGADGAHSQVRHALYPNKKIRCYTSVQQWFEEQHTQPFYSCLFDEQNTDCYSWSISKDNRFIFGGAYPARHCREGFEAQKRLLERQGYRFGKPLRTEACQVLRPASPWQLCSGHSNAFLVGEAGGFISPSSLEGISSAMATARKLADILLRPGGNPNAAYWRATLPLRLTVAVKLCKCPFMYWPWLRRLVLRSRLQAIEVFPQQN